MKTNLPQVPQILNIYMIYQKKTTTTTTIIIIIIIIIVLQQIMCGSAAKGNTDLQYLDGFTVSDPDLNCVVAPQISTNSKLSNCF
jgi:hypothetical protein